MGIYMFAAGLGHRGREFSISQSNKYEDHAARGEGEQGAYRSCAEYPVAGKKHPAPPDHRTEGQCEDVASS